MSHTYRLIIACPDRVGIVAAVSEYIARYRGWITEADHFADAAAGWFFMRNEIRADSLSVSVDDFCAGFAEIAARFAMHWHWSDTARPPRVAILASRADHCLADLLYRWHSEELHCEIACVIANHDLLRRQVEWHGLPFYHVPVDPADKAAHFAEVEHLIDAAAVDLIVLARYMQILPPALCEKYAGRAINIHHSFLPAFIGSKPYHQAYERGVKLIGATCHYVTSDLDAGPIIDQDVIRVRHTHSPEDMVRLGRDVEKAVLARGVRWHLEDRVLIHDNKTVVFA